jgi:hypothetical protein
VFELGHIGVWVENEISKAQYSPLKDPRGSILHRKPFVEIMESLTSTDAKTNDLVSRGVYKSSCIRLPNCEASMTFRLQ